uniref:Calx-beta domain-containing protein n=1 Tax=Ditylenchus dipsaci TaxID=166011 RepID=A0A915DGX9_9BILA
MHKRSRHAKIHAESFSILPITLCWKMLAHLMWWLAEMETRWYPNLLPRRQHQKISIEIVDDDVFEEDEHFYLHLTNLRVRNKDGLILDPSRLGGVPVAMLEMPTAATIMILDDDHAGVFSFEHDHYQIVENCGHLNLRIQRTSGVRGQVTVPYRTYDGTATGGKHYEMKEGEVLFDDNKLIDTEQYERSDFFYVELLPPIWSKKMSDLSKVQERFHRRMERKRASSLTPLQSDEHHISSGSKEKHLSVRRMTEALNSVGETEENPLNLTADQLEVAELGKPRLGEFRKVQITIKESKEFQVKNLFKKMLVSYNTSSF